MGQHPSTFEGTSKQYGRFRHPSMGPETAKHNRAHLANSIGLGSDKSNFFQTSYGISMKDRGGVQSTTHQDTSARATQKSNFSIGGNSGFQGQTTGQSAFKPMGNAAVAPDMEFVKMIKDNHFALGPADETGPYKSVSKSAFVAPNDPSKLRGAINADRKADLRKNHFDFNDNTQPSVKKTVNAETYVPITEKVVHGVSNAQILKD